MILLGNRICDDVLGEYYGFVKYTNHIFAIVVDSIYVGVYRLSEYFL